MKPSGRNTPIYFLALVLLAGCGVRAADPVPTDVAKLCADYGGVESSSRSEHETPGRYSLTIWADCKDGSYVSRTIAKWKMLR